MKNIRKGYLFMGNFTEIKHYGIITTSLSKNGYWKEINYGIWYNNIPKIDIREFTYHYDNETKKEGNGITFSKEEAREVVNYLTKLINYLEENECEIAQMHKDIDFGEDIIYGSNCKFEFKNLKINNEETIEIKKLSKENSFVKLIGIILFEEENEEENTEIKSCKVCIQYFSITKDKKIIPDNRGITLDKNYEIKKTIEYLNIYLNDNF
jgi:hypothetical protein